MQSPIVEVTLQNAREVLEQSNTQLVLFQFHSARSEGCQQLTPILVPQAIVVGTSRL